MNKKTAYSKNQSIVFIGFMGVGKTTIGKQVALKLNREFVDIDQEIEAFFHLPATEIFKQYGEKAFREKEKSLIDYYAAKESMVISVGGGAFMQKDIHDTCMKNCYVIYLDISWENWKERIDLIIDSRPVLQSKSLKEMEELFYARQKIYSDHHSKIDTNELDPEAVSQFIADSLNT